MAKKDEKSGGDGAGYITVPRTDAEKQELYSITREKIRDLFSSTSANDIADALAEKAQRRKGS